MSSLTDAQLRSEIAKLTASINQHRSSSQVNQPTSRYNRNYTYVNPNYKPQSYKPLSASKSIPTRAQVVQPPRPSSTPAQSAQQPGTVATKEVVLNGVAFESSGCTLVRKDRKYMVTMLQRTGLCPRGETYRYSVPKPTSNGTNTTSRPPPPPALPYQRKSGHLIANTRVYKPKHHTSRQNMNMTLTNSRRPYQKPQLPNKRKYTNKPCPRFSTTGTCNRARTCMYQHDPSKIAICWNFLQGNCQKTAETCDLSHDPTPQRTPLCMHFISGSCTRENCPFPHVNVGTRTGVCRDFAVLGYCEKGLDCDKQHVRECPDFAEQGACSTKGCKLPHVIRANRNRKPTSSTRLDKKTTTPSSASAVMANTVPGISANVSGLAVATAEGGGDQRRFLADAQLGDEYISLTFNESDSDDDEEEEQDDEGVSGDEDGANDDNDENVADGGSPSSDQ